MGGHQREIEFATSRNPMASYLLNKSYCTSPNETLLNSEFVQIRVKTVRLFALLVKANGIGVYIWGKSCLKGRRQQQFDSFLLFPEWGQEIPGWGYPGGPCDFVKYSPPPLFRRQYVWRYSVQTGCRLHWDASLDNAESYQSWKLPITFAHETHIMRGNP